MKRREVFQIDIGITVEVEGATAVSIRPIIRAGYAIGPIREVIELNIPVIVVITIGYRINAYNYTLTNRRREVHIGDYRPGWYSDVVF